ncbi:cyclic-phosphate processing receiver domain-containing protein [Paenibacillus alba]|uniref:cyclic-phosphate processing receiver domain-containing protein n=1 Tax=Paenibacillus alba TaxID=1197127 RepID=UPI002DBC7FF7|nr:cyclic-phosphate processing receiver domain-containing protein [Paenibacillus alba]
MKANIYLDDLRDCPEGFIVARTFEEAIQYFKRYTIEILSLDHDLGEDENGNELPNGYDFVKHFCENGLRASKIFLHTDNHVSAASTFKLLSKSVQL